MPGILSHPFRLHAGRVATVEQDSDTADAEQIAVLALTRLGERPLVPGFGMTDPTFVGFDEGELRGGVAVYGPPVTIHRVTTTQLGEAEQAVDVAFE